MIIHSDKTYVTPRADAIQFGPADVLSTSILLNFGDDNAAAIIIADQFIYGGDF